MGSRGGLLWCEVESLKHWQQEDENITGQVEDSELSVLEHLVWTYGGGSPKRSLMENVFSGCVSRTVQSLFILSNMVSSSSIIVGLRSGLWAIHVATAQRTSAELVSIKTLGLSLVSVALVKEGRYYRIHTYDHGLSVSYSLLRQTIVNHRTSKTGHQQCSAESIGVAYRVPVPR